MDMLQFGLLHLGLECEFPIEVASSGNDLYGECHVVCQSSMTARATVRTLVSVYEREQSVTMGGAWAVNPPPSKKKKKIKLTFNVFGEDYTKEASEPDEVVGLIIDKVGVIPGLNPVVISMSELVRQPIGLKLSGEIEQKTLYTETKR